jgi:hypothetical protein
VSPKYTNSPLIRFPDIDYSYYGSIATYTYWTDKTYTSLNYPGQNVVILVHGDATVNGTYNGVVTIVVTDDITVNGSLTAANSSSYLALIAYDVLDIEPAATPVDAVFYCHNPFGTGLVQIRGTKTVTGSIAGDDVTTDHSVTLNPSSRLNINVMRQLHLPGL